MSVIGVVDKRRELFPIKLEVMITCRQTRFYPLANSGASVLRGAAARCSAGVHRWLLMKVFGLHLSSRFSIAQSTGNSRVFPRKRGHFQSMKPPILLFFTLRESFEIGARMRMPSPRPSPAVTHKGHDPPGRVFYTDPRPPPPCVLPCGNHRPCSAPPPMRADTGGLVPGLPGAAAASHPHASTGKQGLPRALQRRGHLRCRHRHVRVPCGVDWTRLQREEAEGGG